MIITVINQKGGVSKTTTTQAIGQGLSLKGYRVLFIDTDPQANLSQALGYNIQAKGLYEVFKKEATAGEVIQQTPGGELIPSTIDLATADLEFTATGREYLLKGAIEGLKKNYDFIIIDTPPALGILTINALTITDYVLVPLTADIFSLQGLKKLAETISVVKEYTNPKLEILGLLLTRYNTRAILNQDIKEALEGQAKALKTRLFKTSIRESIAIKEAQSLGENLIQYNSKGNKPANDYIRLIEEILDILKISK